jgi:hypothetical protein
MCGNETMPFEINDTKICYKCYREHYVQCRDCCNYVLRDVVNEIYDNYGDLINIFCNECLNKPRIWSYGYKPKPIFQRLPIDNEDTLMFGVELEVEFPPMESCEPDGNRKYGIAKTHFLHSLPDFTYAKSDSSIKFGAEIVSHPFTYNWFIKNRSKWDSVFDLRLKKFASYNTETCGIHVHLCKNAFGTLHLYKFLKLFYENPHFMLKVSCRKKANLREWAGFNRSGDERIIYKAKHKCGGMERHVAVNITEFTVEVRIFRGSLHPVGFFKTIEFCKLVYDFTKDSSVKDVNIKNLLEYALKRQKEYQNFHAFAAKTNLYNYEVGKQISKNIYKD